MSDNDRERELQHRLEALTADLNALHGAANKDKAADERIEAHAKSTGQALSLGFRVLAEFVSAILVGGLIGWQIDNWFHSTPAGLIVFLALGTAAGMWNVYRLAAGPALRPPNSKN
jgi:ATP synthase protein I